MRDSKKLRARDVAFGFARLMAFLVVGYVMALLLLAVLSVLGWNVPEGAMFWVAVLLSLAMFAWIETRLRRQRASH